MHDRNQPEEEKEGPTLSELLSWRLSCAAM